jgi:hypothetical protein
MTINIYELEYKLLTTLDALADGAKLATAARAAGVSAAYILHAIKKSETRHPDYAVSWRDEHARQFCELVPLAQRMGRIAREQRLRGVTVNGEQQFVLDPALLARFGTDDDAKDMAELAGYPQYPFALDADGNKIPLLSARHPRPQRKHRNSPPRNAVGEQSRGADTESEQSAAGMPIRDWRPDDPEPPYSRNVRCAADPPRVFVSTPSSPRVAAPPSRVAALNEQIARGVSNPRPVDNMGRPTMPNSIYFIGKGVNDPPERTTGG